MADEWVTMTHPEVGDAPNPVTRKAFELTWSKKGYRIKGESPPPQSRLQRNQPQPEGEK